ncbi:MAG TPA: PQQ-binding-like beta-propeller repeat protein [Patescibacteria group bacterium]|nr:PQQ-binding-like beta-propeller repeat protein [Patescibacteria group bacterium]
MAFLRGAGWLSGGLAAVIHFTPAVTTRCLDGGPLLKNNPLVRRPAFIFLFLAVVLLSACGSRVANNNWPGMTSSGDTVYVSFGPGVVAFDIEQQEQSWYFSPDDGGPSLQIFAPPSVVDGQIAFGDYGKSGGMISPNVTVTVYMLDEENPQNPTWTQSTVAQDRIVAQALQIGDRLYIGTADNFLVALDVENNGQPVWNEPFEAGHSIWGQTAYEDGVLYVPSLDKFVHALDAETGEILWQADVGGSVSDKPILNGDLVYAGSFDKQLHALYKTTGESRWTAPAEGSVWGAPVVNGGSVYFVDLLGNAYAVDATTGEQFWQYATGGYVVAAPVFHDGVVYVSSGGDPDLEAADRIGALIAIDANTGKELWRITDLDPIFTTPAIVGDAIVVATQSEEHPLTVTTIDTTEHDRTSTLFPELPSTE